MAKRPWNVLSTAALVGSIVAVAAPSVMGLPAHAAAADAADAFSTTTPIKHVVVIFQENVSFDHYFGTYPYATNPAGEPQFHAAPGTPTVNGLSPALLTYNPNSANPQRLDRSQAQTDDMDHGYTDEQKAYDGGLVDKFVQSVGAGSWPTSGQDPSIVMDYYDGNTVTGLWNYAQHFAMSDNSYNTTFGPSTPGALNLVSGQTHGATAYSGNSTASGVTQLQPDQNGVIIKGKLDANNTLYSDADPYYDSASKGTTIAMSGLNVGDLLNQKNVTWGWFEGGFADPTATHTDVGGVTSADYIPHHEPFQYYKSTANPNHLPPTATAMIGYQDQANHQYDLTDFWKAADSGNMPAVSFLKAPGYQDGHAGYSTPLDEQNFLVNTINHLETLPEWKDTAVIINYDDSDGWYDHVMPPIVNGSSDPIADALDGTGNAGTVKLGTYQDRAGYGPRLPMMIISPYAKQNFVDHSISDQSSILRFIEDNWNLGRIGDGSFDAIAGSLNSMFDFQDGPRAPKLFLDPSTGEALFNDVSAADPDAGYIADLYGRGVVHGVGGFNFDPQGNMSREELAALIAQAFALQSGSTAAPFGDVTDAWAKPSINAAYAAGLISGTAQDAFSPLQNVSREAVATIVWRYLSSQGVQAPSNASTVSVTADGYAKTAVQNVIALGLVPGAGTSSYDATAPITREEAATMVDLGMKLLKK